ncbi:type I-E CRISPR-associated protein Cas6/Cse3/CasE [uncultured Microbulbifer sp.]|uniref:type I-E CRISPR-associated protein Cas6/Cse3/CasE n=1 Tax=uncultured Microbulbifer sp. TaxID=348147 RepID=UPI00262E9B66|nr:type I-E CRISPR-associated protein Cas6/Cse3/CasE [uncultured Microbulbifer sp.]
MYLSRIQLSSGLAVQAQLATLLKNNSYGMHQMLWELFRSDERFLFREESAREQLLSERNQPVFFLLSREKPAEQSPLFNVETKLFRPNLQQGDRLTFRLRANPTISRKPAGGGRSKRHDVLMDAQYHWLRDQCGNHSLDQSGGKGELKQRLLNTQPGLYASGQMEAQLQEVSQAAAHHWLIDRGPRMGFDILSSKLQSYGYRWNILPKKDRAAGFSSVDYCGELLVTEPETFLQRVYAGIGPAKAFGCGLMLIRRI